MARAGLLGKRSVKQDEGEVGRREGQAERMLCSGLEAAQDGGKVWEPLRRQRGSRRF